MKTLTLFLALIVSALAQVDHRAFLPDPVLTPGVIDPTVTAKDLESPEFIKESRHVSNALKESVYAAYGITNHPPGVYEVDHKIPKCLAGADVKENLWPQGYHWQFSAHHKDRLEVALHHLVKAGSITLEDAQERIKTDWIAAYAQLFPKDVLPDGTFKPIGKQPGSNPDK